MKTRIQTALSPMIWYCKNLGIATKPFSSETQVKVFESCSCKANLKIFKTSDSITNMKIEN